MNNDLEKAKKQPITLLRIMRSTLTEAELAGGMGFPDTDDEGKAAQSQANILHFFRKLKLVMMRDEFALRTHIVGLPGHPFLNDEAFEDIYVAMDLVGLRLSRDYLWAVLNSYGRNISSHAVREKMDFVESSWDGEPRLDNWLTKYCGAEDNAYTRAIGAKWMIAAVRRIRQPGCKFDHILILEGGQGSGKSTVFRVLAYDQWFTDNLTIGVEPKEVIELTRGKWICELAELTNIAKKDVEAAKSFVTRQRDEARLAFGKVSSEIPRQFVLGATTNKARYLRDETGDRRFWVITTMGVKDTGLPNLPLMLDVDGLREALDQLWGEAASRESAGETIFLSPEVEALARTEQAKRFELDDRQQFLEDLLEGQQGFVPSVELYKALGMTDVKERHPGLTKLVASCMQRISWQATRVRIGHGDNRAQTRGFTSPLFKQHCVLVWSEPQGRFIAVGLQEYGLPLRDGI